MHIGTRKRSAAVIAAVILNLVLVACVVLSVFAAFNDAEQTSFSQNTENVRTLTNASASKIALELEHHTQELKRVSEYVSSYGETGMTRTELIDYFSSFYGQKNENYSWQLVESQPNGRAGSALGFDAISLSSPAASEFYYSAQSYGVLAKLFVSAGADQLGEIRYTGEFTDPAPGLNKASAITATVRVRDEDGASEERYYTLMLLLRSAYINELIASNNDIDNLSYFDYSNIIVDRNGDYVISNSAFQGTNFMDYIALYNADFTREDGIALQEAMQEDGYSGLLFYQNNRQKDCAYTIVPVQNSNWYILSVVPVDSFHSSYDYRESFGLFAVLFGLLFLLDIAVMLVVNHQLRVKTKEAEAANRSKSLFLSSMSHDIRTPMNAIIGMTILANQQLEQERVDKAVLQDCVKSIERSGNHLLSLINDILDVSKIESGKILLHESGFSITGTLAQVLEFCQPGIQDGNLALEIAAEEVEHPFAVGDQLRINQIFTNILTNAVKYTPPQGHISVSLTESPVPGKPELARYVYRVSDTGIGMTPEFLETIFDRFTRAVDTRINSVQGTGLGMAIVNMLVELMGGTIQVQSEVDVGSVFTVTLELPIGQGSGAARPAGTEPAGALPGRGKTPEKREQFPGLRVLVAEDNVTNWRIMSQILAGYGVQVERAENGREAVRALRERDGGYDLVLMDIQMPVMNGYEAARAIRALPDIRRAAIPIYALTADTFASDVEKCGEAGMNGHLAKPIEMEKVLAIVRGVYRTKTSAVSSSEQT